MLQKNIPRQFPRKQQDDDLYFDELDDFNKKIVLKHLKISGKIKQWLRIRVHLKDEMHQKKCTLKRTKYHPNDLIIDRYYRNYLHTGKKVMNSWDMIPYSFQGLLENVMLKEMSTKKFNYIPIYYGEAPRDFNYNNFDIDKWTFSDHNYMTPEDIDIMEKYKSRYITFVTKCVKLINKYRMDRGGKYSNELIRIINVMNQ